MLEARKEKAAAGAAGGNANPKITAVSTAFSALPCRKNLLAWQHEIGSNSGGLYAQQLRVPCIPHRGEQCGPDI